jgi:hypothetical protein
VRYPTNVKLLWESVEWCYGQLKLDVQIFEGMYSTDQVPQAKRPVQQLQPQTEEINKRTKNTHPQPAALAGQVVISAEDIEQEHADRLQMPAMVLSPG